MYHGEDCFFGAAEDRFVPLDIPAHYVVLALTSRRSCAGTFLKKPPIELTNRFPLKVADAGIIEVGYQ